MKICLDLDGVITKFVEGAAKVIGYDPKVVTEWDYYHLVGETEQSFWDKIDAVSPDFWANLELYDWAYELIFLCQTYGEIIFLTSPSRSALSSQGKVLWMQKHFGFNFRQYLIGPKKEFCANTNTILIDDSDKNIHKFEKAGGKTILFPQPWNANRNLTSDRMPYMRRILNEIHRH